VLLRLGGPDGRGFERLTDCGFAIEAVFSFADLGSLLVT
jgi:hypothetical protein